MFTPSTLAVSAAVIEIADCAGASGDQEMLARAFRSLNAGIKYINARQNWTWLLTENSPITVVAPFAVAITAGASGVASASAAAGHGVKVDDFIVVNGLGLGARISATAASALGFNTTVTGITASTTASAVVTRDFYDLPTDWKMPYSVRTLKVREALRYVGRRMYDRGISDEFMASTPQWYDLFAGYQKGKIRLLPAPAASDTLILRYYRRMAVATSSADATVLDIPQDYDFHLIAWCKWHFLVDKTEGRSDQATTWLNLAKEGLSVMLADQTRIPDEEIRFTPGWLSFRPDVNSTRSVDWDYTG